MRALPKTIMQLGNGLKDIKPDLKLVDLDSNDKSFATKIFADILSSLKTNEKYSIEEVLTADTEYLQGNNSKSEVLGGFIIRHKASKSAMTLSVHLQKYNNGKYVLSLVTGKDQDEFKAEINPQTYKANNLFLQKVIDQIFSSIDNASLVMMSSNEDHRLIGPLKMDGKDLDRMIEGTPYFKAKIPTTSIEAVQSYARNNENVDVAKGVVTVKRDEITEYSIYDKDHARNLFEVTQMIKGQQVNE